MIAGFLACAAALNYADRAAVAGVFVLLRRDLGLSDVALGSVGSVFLWSYAAGSPLAGMLADRFSRSRLIALSLLLWSAVMAVTGFANGLAALLVMRALLGLFESMYLPAATALLAEHHTPATRGTAMGIHSVGLNLGVVIGGTVAGYLGDHFGWRPGFWILGSAGVLLGVAAWFVLRDGPLERAPASAPREPFLRSLLRLASIPSYLILVAKAMLAGVGVWIFLNWLPLYFRDAFGMNLAAAGFAGTFMLQFPSTLGIASGGWISDKLALRATRNRMLYQSLTYFAAAPFLLLFLGRPGFWAVAAAVACFSLLRGMGQANENPTLCDVVPPRLRSTAIGFMNLGATLAGGIGVLLAGVLKRTLGLNGVFAAISMAFVAAGALLLVGYLVFMPRDIARAQENLTLAR